MTDNWRTGTNAEDFFRHEQKRVALERRRPVVRKASDLVGPGIAASAVRVTDYNNLLATFNGYYSSAPGALFAPNATEGFVGFTAMDSEYGGFQKVTGMTTGVECRRVFHRNPADAETIVFEPWTKVLPDVDWTDVTFRAGSAWQNYDSRTVQYCRLGGMVIHRGIMKNGGNTVAFTNPVGFRPEPRSPSDYHFPCVASGAVGILTVEAAVGTITFFVGSDVYVDVSAVRYKAYLP